MSVQIDNDRLIEMIDEYIDGELPVEYVSSFLSETEKRPELQKLLKQKKDVAFSLRNMNDEAPEGLHEAIMGKIREKTAPVRFKKRICAACAAAVIFLAGGIFIKCVVLPRAEKGEITPSVGYSDVVEAGNHAVKNGNFWEDRAADLMPALPEDYPRGARYYIVGVKTGLGELGVSLTNLELEDAAQKLRDEGYSVVDLSDRLGADPEASEGVVFTEK